MRITFNASSEMLLTFLDHTPTGGLLNKATKCDFQFNKHSLNLTDA